MRTAAILFTTLSLATTPALADRERSIFQKVYKNSQSIQQNANDIDNLDSRVQTNTNNIQQLSNQIQNLPSGGGTGSNNDAQVQANTTAIFNLTADVQNNTTAINNLSGQAQSNTSAIEANLVLIQGNSATLNSMSPQVQANTSAINQLSVDLNALQNTLSGLASNVDSNSTNITALETEVQSNANAISSLTTRIDALEAAGTGGGTTPVPEAGIDFTLYVSDMSMKEFRSSSNVSCTILRQNFSRTTSGGVTNLDITETLTSVGGRDCTIYNYNYVQTPVALSLTAFENSSAGTLAIFDGGGDVMTNSMQVGKAFGFAITNTSNPAQTLIQKNTVLGMESVSVPYGSYDNCLKIHSTMTSTVTNMPKGEQISWHCEGIGEVKRVYMDPSPATPIIHVYKLDNATL